MNEKLWGKTHKLSLGKQIVKPEKNKGKRKEKKQSKKKTGKTHQLEAESLLARRGSGFSKLRVFPCRTSLLERMPRGYPGPSQPHPLCPPPLTQVDISFSAFNTLVVFYPARVLFKMFFIYIQTWLYILGIIHYRFRVQKSFFFFANKLDF